MKKNINEKLSLTLYRTGLSLMCAVGLCMGMTSCLDEINDRLDSLEQRVSDLEKSLADQIDGLKQLVDGKTTITSWKLDESTNTYEFILSDGSTLSIAKGSGSAPLIGVAKDDLGVYYWILDGEPLLGSDNGYIYLESSSAPSVRVNPDSGEWEISPDGGKTYLGTGIKAGENASLVSKVSEDELYVYLTLSDGSQLRVEKTVDSRIAILAGKQYFTYGQKRTVKLALEGVNKTALFSKPDGWKVSLKSDELTVIAPAQDNMDAELSGTVIVQAWFSDKTSDIAEIKVEVGEAPHEIKVDQAYNITVSTSEELKKNEDNWGNWLGYALGVSKLADFSEEWVKSYIAENMRIEWHFSADTDYTLERLIGSAPEKGESYVVWAVDKFDDNGMGNYYGDVLYTVVTTSDLRVEAADITFEDAIINVTPKGVSKYYAGMFNVAERDIETILNDINDNWYTVTYNNAYKGSLKKYGAEWGENTIRAGATYCVFAIPYVNGKTYTKEDVVSIEVKINPIVPGGTAEVLVDDVNVTITSISANISRGNGAYKYFSRYISDDNISQYVDDEALIGHLTAFAGRTDSYTLTSSGMTPDTKGWIVAVAVDKAGNAGPVVRKEANTLPISFSSLIISEPAVSEGLTEVTVTFPATAGIKQYRYIDISKSRWETDYIFKGDEDITEKQLAIETIFASYSPYRLADANADGSLTVTLTGRSSEAYVLFVEGVDEQGLPTRMVRADYTPSLSSDLFVKSTDAGYAAVTLSDIMMDGTPIADFPRLVDQHSGSHKFTCNVELPANCAKYWFLVCDGSIVRNAAGEKNKTSAILTYYDVRECTPDNTAVSYGYFNYASDLYIVWQDNDGKYYCYKQYNINEMTKE